MSHCSLPCITIKLNSPQRSRRIVPFNPETIIIVNRVTGNDPLNAFSDTKHSESMLKTVSTENRRQMFTLIRVKRSCSSTFQVNNIIIIHTHTHIYTYKRSHVWLDIQARTTYESDVSDFGVKNGIQIDV